MMLRVFNKKSPALGLFKVTLLKNIGSIILLSVAMLIFCPGFILTGLSKVTFRPEDYTSPDVLSGVYSVCVVCSSILVCVANYVNFAYLYKKSSSDVLEALPLTRTSMLFSRAAAGFVSVLIPVTLGYVSLGFLGLRYPAYAVGTIAQIASAYLVNILFMLAFSGFSLIFILCAGSGFDLVLSFGGFNIAVLAVGAIYNGLCDSYLTGYSSESDGIMRTVSPIYNLAERGVLFATGGFTFKGLGNTVPGILEYAAAFFFISVLLYRYRKAERGEQAYAYRFIYVICGVLAGICGGYALSEIFVFAAEKKEYSIIGFITFIVGALITTVVYGAVTERGFKGFKKSMAIGGISAIIYAITAAILLTGAFGFTTRIPEISKVTSVTVNFEDETINFKDPAAVIALHKAIIDKKADTEVYSYEDDEDEEYSYLDIKYYSGNSKMLREYYVKVSKVKNELFKIYASDERFADIDKFINEAPNGKLSISGDYDIGDEEGAYLNGGISREVAENIISRYRKELNAAGGKFFDDGQRKDMVATVFFEVEREDGAYDDISFYTTSDFPETNKMLMEFIDEDEVATK